MSSSPTPKYRSDLEGLRAVAVLLVVLYHAGISQVPGGFIGVDIFFVLSGYFISQQLWGQLEQNGKVSLVDFYTRRIRRILPAASLVIAVTALLAWALLSPVYASEIGWDAISAALNVANIRFSIISNNYFDTAAAGSPFIHFWSLGIEEQFYLFWPLIFLAVGFAMPKSGGGNARRRKALVIGLMSVVTFSSFVWSVYQTGIDQTGAFYLLPSRAWELGLGGLLAVAATRFAPHRLVSVAASAVAFAMIAYTVVAYTDKTPFPGLGALLPVVATALLVLAGSTRNIAGGLLSIAPMRAIGRWSFSLYLWHWPILVFLDQKLGAQNNIRFKLFAMFLAVILAAATYAFLENPIRFSARLKQSARSTFRFGAIALLMGAVAGTPMVAQAALGGSQSIAVASNIRTIDLALREGLKPHPVPINLTPSLANAKDTSRGLTATTRCMANFADVVFPDCEFGNVNSNFTIWLVGDSHANHWFPAVKKVVDKYRLRLVVHARAGCPILDVVLTDSNNNKAQHTLCAAWTKQVMTAMQADQPDLVLDAGTTPIVGKHVASYVNQINRMKTFAKQVLVLGDTPHTGIDTPTCVSQHLDDASFCKMDRSNPEGMNIPRLEAGVGRAVKAAGVPYIPTSDWVCINQDCPVVVGNVLLYRDVSHLTDQGGELFAPYMERALLPYLPQS